MSLRFTKEYENVFSGEISKKARPFLARNLQLENGPAGNHES